MKQILYVILITLINYACTQSPSETVISEPTPETEYLTIPFDTAEVIASLNIVDYMNRLDLIESDTTSGLNDKVDTIICYNNIYLGAIKGGQAIWQEIEYKDCTAYSSNYPLHQHYIEPRTEELNIHKNTPWVNYRTSVMFIGRKYKTPYKEGELSENSWAGERFKYYYYELILPYYVYVTQIETVNESCGEYTLCPEFKVKELQTKKE